MPLSEAWTELLGRFEAGLDDAERRLAAGQAPLAEGWTPPAHVGELPVDLFERAAAVLGRQRELAVRLEDARSSAGRHLAALQAIPSPRRGHAAVYLDVTG